MFMALDDVSGVVGRVTATASSATRAPHYTAPALNYTGGATMIAAFDLGGTPRTFEFFAAVGRPGEPVLGADPAPNGVSVLRFTTTDFRECNGGSCSTLFSVVHSQPTLFPLGHCASNVCTKLPLDPHTPSLHASSEPPYVIAPPPLPETYSNATTALFLENGSGGRDGTNDGEIWTVKSMDRDVPAGQPGGPGVKYVLFAAYGSSAHTFASTDITVAHSLKPTTGDLTKGNFKDHDDTNMFYDQPRKMWIDFQIMYEAWNKTYCDNVDGYRRVVTVRNSSDGVNWSDDFGCTDHPQTSEHCSKVTSC